MIPRAQLNHRLKQVMTNNTNNPNKQVDESNSALREVLHYITTNPIVAHETYFSHRHPQPSAPFHREMLLDWYSPEPDIQHIVFRGGAKSTLGEEAITMIACTATAMNIPIIGSSQPRAKERLAAIKHELETNDLLIKTFGNLIGDTWAETKIVLKNNVAIHALGWDQSMRGIKHFSWRPDFCWIDDIEDEENTSSPEARAKVVRRLTSVVIPAVDAPGRRIRITGTPLDPESLVENIRRHPDWETRVFPAKYRHPVHKDKWVASWPQRKSLEDLDKLERSFRELGDLNAFEREYMCNAVAEETKRFKEEHMRAEPIVRTYQATYAVYDPARTTNELSAHTGKFVFSWDRNRIIVWESGGYYWKPDEIVNDLFAVNEKYNPIHIGVEENGLHEFIMQPIRQESMRRGEPLPIKALRAPKGKLNFIQGLQPFFAAGEVIFSPDKASHAEAIKQFKSFPSGKIDIPNAAAYALKMRPGLPMFDNFNDNHIDPLLAISKNSPFFLAVHSELTHTTGVLVQLAAGQYRVLADWIYEGDPGPVLSDIYKAATMLVMKPVKVVVPPMHFSNYDTIGLRAAAKSHHITLHKGGDTKKGLEEVRAQLGYLSHGRTAFVISPLATWTLRAFAGGYARKLDKTGFLSEEPEGGPYATLMHGLQSLLSFSNVGTESEGKVYAQTASGHAYLTARR